MEEGKKKIQVVTSVGNAWVICQSKSHPGYIYYFNTETGEAAWNLSNAEIDKAKNSTKISGSLEFYAGCPEPTEPPMIGQSQVPSTSNQNITTPRIYNKQIINNKFPSQACTFSQNPNVQFALTSFNPVAWKMPDVPTFNTGWDVSPSHQIFIAPSIAQELSPATALNIANLQSHNLSVPTPLPMSKRFGENNIWNSITPARGFRKYRNEYNYRFQNPRAHYFNKRMFQNNVTVSDLRQKLCAKRSTVNNCKRIDYVNEDPETHEHDFEEETENNATLGKQTKKVAGHEDPQSKLDLKPLRDLAVPEATLDCWYIVADTSVLLSNLIYLITVIDSDEDCCLMIPQNVMTKLQALAFSSERTKFRARNAIRVLTQQFDAGSAFITSEESSQTENDECTNVFNCCLFLVKGNNHVVLLSNNIEMLRYKYTTQIPIFTIPELRNLLRNESFQQSNECNQIPNHDRLIKITVVNDAGRNVEVQDDHEIPSIDSSIIKFDDEESTDLPKCNEYSTQTEDLAGTSNVKVDAGVQTEHTPETAKTSLGDYIQYDVDDIVSDTVKGTKDLNVNKHSFGNQKLGDSTCKTREIRLYRSLSNQTSQKSIDNTVDKKQFKWRRRKSTSTAVEDKSNVCTADNVCLKSNSAQEQQIIPSSTITYNENADMHDAAINADLSLESAGNICSNIEDSESSASMKGCTFDKVIIEETSTSSIISNTESNIESEIVTAADQQKWQSKEYEINNVMFEITSHNMEEFLKMRCDEWVSRFVQIMEDVLTEILQQDPQFTHNEWPPPWTIREATHCIAMKFSSYPNIVDAAYKLSNILRQVSDNRGVINVNLEPSEYMKMYSYGVYMVDTLQDEHSCEDLQIASESLRKLLNDIENANQDCCQNESFVDFPPKNTREGTEPEQHSTDVIQEHNIDTKEQQDGQKSPDKLLNSSNYNLRSNKRKIPEKEEEEEREVKFIRNINIEYSFFNSLKLNKTYEKCDKLCDTEQHNEKFVATTSLPNIKQNVYFEEDQQLDYEEDLDYGDEEYDEDRYYYDKEDAEFGDGDLEETLDQKELNQSEIRPPNNINNEQKFKYFVGVFLKEIRETFGQVQTLCEGYYEDINGPQNIDAKKRKEMKEKAEKAHLLVEDLCKCLDSILQREENDPGNSIQNLLKTAQFNDFYLDDNMCAEYKSIITKCKDQAATVLSSIRLIINSIENLLSTIQKVPTTLVNPHLASLAPLLSCLLLVGL